MASARAALDSNPFDDPSVQSAMHSGGDDLENPFDTESLRPGSVGGYAPPLDEDEDEVYPTSTHGTAPAHAMHDDDLARRERELEERERELDARTEHMRKFGRNNWPPFYPLIYHDIDSEIPPDSQEVMKHLYYLWLLWSATLVWNLPTMVLMAIYAGGNFIGAVFYLVLLIPLSFVLWYRPVYNGLMKEHSLFYYVYFLFAGFHLLFSAYAIIGYPSSGCGGIWSVVHAFSNKKILAGVFAVISTAGFSVQGLGNLWYYRVVRVSYSPRFMNTTSRVRCARLTAEGHTFAQAKAELASHGMRAYLYVFPLTQYARLSGIDWIVGLSLAKKLRTAELATYIYYAPGAATGAPCGAPPCTGGCALVYCCCACCACCLALLSLSARSCFERKDS